MKWSIYSKNCKVPQRWRKGLTLRGSWVSTTIWITSWDQILICKVKGGYLWTHNTKYYCTFTSLQKDNREVSKRISKKKIYPLIDTGWVYTLNVLVRVTREPSTPVKPLASLVVLKREMTTAKRLRILNPIAVLSATFNETFQIHAEASD